MLVWSTLFLIVNGWVLPGLKPKQTGITVVKNDNNELVPTRLITGWRMCVGYRKLNDSTRKYHFLLPFIDQRLERLVGRAFYYFLDGYSGYNQIPIALEDQEKITFTCHFQTFAYRMMLFGLCNALHDEHIFRFGGASCWSIYGWLLYIWQLFWSLFTKSAFSPWTMPKDKLCVKLEKSTLWLNMGLFSVTWFLPKALKL